MRASLCLAAFAALPTLVSYSALGESVRQPSGMYVMQGLHQTNVSDSVLSSPVLSGIYLRDAWSLLEPAPLAESFDWLDGQISRAKSLGKEVTLGIYAGVRSPTWLNVPLCNGVPIPWDPLVQSAHNEMVAALGNRYRDESAIVAVHISSPATNRSLEMFLADGLTTLPDYSDQKIIDSWMSSIDAYSDAFPKTSLVLDIAMVPDVDGAITDAVTSYAQSVLGSRANFIHCSLKATTNPAAPHHQTVLALHQAGSQIGFEMVSPSSDTTRFGGPFTDALAIGQVAGASWYQIYQSDISNIPANFFSVAGDYNHDGVVDGGDYLVWRNTFGSTNMSADGDGNGRIDDGDFAIWRGNFGAANAQVGASGSAVPEQSTCALLMVFTVIVPKVFHRMSSCGVACRSSIMATTGARKTKPIASNGFTA